MSVYFIEENGYKRIRKKVVEKLGCLSSFQTKKRERKSDSLVDQLSLYSYFIDANYSWLLLS